MARALDAAGLAGLAQVGRGTALPSAPNDEDEFFYVADAANGVEWHLKYRAAGTAGKRWEYVGGPPLIATVETSENTASITYVDLATAGPSVTVPLAGDYELRGEALPVSQAAGNAAAIAALKLGTAPIALEAEAVVQSQSAAANQGSLGGRAIVRTLAAADVVKMQYRVSAGNANFIYRTLSVKPVRVG